MASIQEIRAQYPQYDDMSDDDLAQALHGKYYSDMPYEDFAATIGLAQTPNARGKADRDMSVTDYVSDLAKSTGVGAVRGATGIAGLPGDAGQVGDWLGEMGAEKLGLTPYREWIKQNLSFGAPPPGSAELWEDAKAGARPEPSVSQLATGQQPEGPLDYQPRTTLGEYGRTVGEFGVGALGPGGPVRKAAQVLLPGVASETAGQATEGEWYEPHARLGAALLGGGVAAGGRGNITKQIAKGAPSGDSVKQATDAMYDQLRAAGITYDANSFRQMVNDLGQKLGQRFRASQAPHSTSLLKELSQHVGRSPDYQDMEAIRQSFGALLRESSQTVLKSDKAVAAAVLEALDDFTLRAPFATNGSLPAHVVNPMMKQARELARRNIVAGHVDEMVRKAETYQSGFDSGIRNQFGSYLRTKGKGLTKEEYKAFSDVNKGVSSANAVKGLGKFGFDVSRMASQASVVPTMIAGGLAYGGDPLSALLLAGVGTAARYASPRIHQGLANRAKSVVLAGKPGQAKGLLSGKANQQKALVRGLLNIDPALMQARDDRAPVAPFRKPQIQMYGGNR